MKTKFGIGLFVGLILGIGLCAISSLLAFELAKGESTSIPQVFPSATHPIIQVMTSTPAATSTPITPLKLGEWAQWNDLTISVKRYEITDECRGFGDGPAEGAKLIYVWIVVHNVSNNVVELPSFLTELNGIDKHSGWFGGTVCQYDNESLGNACWKDQGKLYPEVECEGWELFEVPEKMSMEGVFAKISAYVWQKDIVEIGRWQLEAK